MTPRTGCGRVGQQKERRGIMKKVSAVALVGALVGALAFATPAGAAQLQCVDKADLQEYLQGFTPVTIQADVPEGAVEEFLKVTGYPGVFANVGSIAVMKATDTGMVAVFPLDQHGCGIDKDNSVAPAAEAEGAMSLVVPEQLFQQWMIQVTGQEI